MSHVEHKATAPQSVRCYVITISDTRTEETDTAGRAIAELLGGAGHQVVGRTIVKDDPGFVRGAIVAPRPAGAVGAPRTLKQELASRTCSI